MTISTVQTLLRTRIISLLLLASISGQLWAQQGDTDVSTESPLAGVSFRFIESNGIRMRIAEAGSGPLVLLAHGWP